MKRKIIMLAVPAIAAATMLGMAGVASASTGSQAEMHVQIFGDPDSGVCGNYWATDDINRTFKVTDNNDGTFNVATNDDGTWHATAGQHAPLDFTCRTAIGSESGPMHGYATFTVSSPNGGASQANLDAALNSGNGVPKLDGSSAPAYDQLVLDLFPAGAKLTSDFTTWGWRYEYRGEVMVQQSVTPNYTDAPAGIFTNGG